MSKLEIIPFKAWHLELLGYRDHGLPQQTADLLESLDSVSILEGKTYLFCGGISEYWPGRGHVWSVFNPESKKNFVPLYRAIQGLLKDRQGRYSRIEMSVDYGFTVANRRARLLGFKLEIERARKYHPGGRDASIYSMVREE